MDSVDCFTFTFYTKKKLKLAKQFYKCYIDYSKYDNLVDGKA